MPQKSKYVLSLIFALISILSFVTYVESAEKKIDDEIILKLLDGKEYEKASIEIKKAFKINPKCAFCYFAQGYIFEQQDARSEAMQNYNKAIELSPDNPFFYYYRGKLNLNMGIFQMGSFNQDKYKQGVRLAIEDFTKAIQLKPNNIDLYYRERADAYMYCAEYEKALLDFERLIPLQEKNVSLLCNIGKCYLESNNPDKALVYLLEANNDEGISDICLADIALAYSLKNEKDRATDFLEMAVNRNEYIAQFGINEYDPRWDNIRETEKFRRVKKHQ